MYSVKVTVARLITATMIAESSFAALLTSYRYLRKRPATLYSNLPQEEEKYEQRIVQSNDKEWEEKEESKLRKEQEFFDEHQHNKEEGCEVASNLERLRKRETINGNNAINKNSLSFDRIRAELQAMYDEMQGNKSVPAHSTSEAIGTHTQNEGPHSEAKQKVNAINTHVQDDKKSGAHSVDEELLTELASRFKLNAKYYYGDDVHTQVAAQRARLRRMLINDAEDVLRCKNKHDVLKYIHYSGVYSSFEDKSELYTLVNRVRDLVSESKVQWRIKMGETNNCNLNNNVSCNDINRSAYTESNHLDVERLSWVQTLQSLSHHEIRLLWHNGLLDAEILEELLTDDENESSNKIINTNNVNWESSAFTTEIPTATENKQEIDFEVLRDGKFTLKEFSSSPENFSYPLNTDNINNKNNNCTSYQNDKTHTISNSSCNVTKTEEKEQNFTANRIGEEDTELTSTATATNAKAPPKLLIDESFNKFEQIRHMSELTREIKNYTLHPTISAPTLELAAVLEKAHEGQMRSITLEELQNLEQYEKSTIHLNVPRPSSSSSISSMNNKKKQLSTFDETSRKSTESKNEVTGNAHDGIKKKLAITEMHLDKSLAPGNYFVHAVAQYDKTLRESLRALEEIRREVLLDTDFQQAVQLSRSMDANSVFTPEQFGQILRHRRSTAHLTQSSHKNGDARSDANNDDSDIDDDDNEFSKMQGNREYDKLSKRSELYKRYKRSTSPRAMLARPHHAADVPYFFGSIRSVIPPRARYNLPPPALSAHEKRVLSGKMRQQYKKKKFTS